ncbi:flagellar protein FlhE [Litchfieldella rifensis]|uniref:Flagellar protein FlhE n=1 Tax=Litchfieldella rifensis TaxID=762643 RepID=A0ABV7LSR5_9GAMM
MTVLRWLAVAMIAVSALSIPPAWAASGSWVAEAPGLRVAVPERETRSPPLAAPDVIPGGARISTLRWRFEASTRRPLQAWLCHPARCIPLSSPSGRSTALAELPATAPLHFRFRLPRGGQAVQVEGVQVIVDYY